MTKQEQNVEAGRKFGEAVNAAGIVERFFGYVVSYIVLTGILLLLIAMPAEDENALVNKFQFLATAVIFGLPALLMFLWERSIRKFRRANGFSITKNIKAELEQMEFNKMYEKERKMEEQARAAYEAKKRD